MKFNKKAWLKRGALLTLPDRRLWIGSGKRSNSGSRLFCPTFFLNDPVPWKSYEYEVKVEISELQRQLTTPKKSLYHSFTTVGDAFFSSEILSFQENKTLKKVVPYLFDVSESSFDLEAALFHLLNQKSTPYYLYGMWDESGGILGASPELLFHQEGKNVNTMAVAGTVKNITDAFNQTEHTLVVDGIVSSLNGIDPKAKIEIGKQSFVSFNQLKHAVTPIKGTMSSHFPFMSLVKALHPTPALGAHPKEEGLDWLKKYNQTVPRERFGAPFGLLGEGISICVVAIRNVQWEAGRCKIGAGCGVLHESVLDNELKEAKLKLYSTKKMLGLA